jgi:signal transduction histidine kinase
MGSVTAIVNNRGNSMRRVMRRDPLMEDEVAQIVHDLRGPLSAIALEATLMNSWLQTDDRSRCVPAVARIHDNVDFLDRVVADLLDVCALAAGAFTLQCAPVELSALLDRVVERVAGPSHDRVNVDAARPVVAVIDDVRMQRVMANLLDNAIRYSPDACPVSITLTSTGARAHITVADTGPGIPANEQAHVFERYRRGSASLDRRGVGLGLYTCKRIVEAHGGKIGVESVRHVGSRFCIELPL